MMIEAQLAGEVKVVRDKSDTQVIMSGWQNCLPQQSAKLLSSTIVSFKRLTTKLNCCIIDFLNERGNDMKRAKR
jgi:hypothetical protein